MDLARAKANAGLLPKATVGVILDHLSNGELPPKIARVMGLPVEVLYCFMKFDPRYQEHHDLIQEIQEDAIAEKALLSADEDASDAVMLKKHDQRTKARQWILERTSKKYSPKKELKGELTVSHASLFE